MMQRGAFRFASVIACILCLSGSAVVSKAAWGRGNPGQHTAINCATPSVTCAETGFNKQVWPDQYVGHDEPGLAFLSSTPGSGNNMAYSFKLPSDPPAAPAPGRSYNFEMGGVFWFGLIVCDTQSYPLRVSTCTPDSDSNVKPLLSHPGAAFVEMQFYAPGWVKWPAGDSCSATEWCAALNIDSLSERPVTGQFLDDSCANNIGSEYVNFAYVTHSGLAQAPANPIQSTSATYTPDPKKDLFMKSGDKIVLKMHDTANGLGVYVTDATSGQNGSMVASAQNGFAQVKFATNPSVECTPIPYNFHPMYSTASAQTLLPWGATQDNVSFVDEIGHFDWCVSADESIRPTRDCPDDGYEGINHNRASDYDDTYCFPGKDSSLVKVNGCLGENTPGFDGASYINDWPNGNLNLHPTPLTFSSPKTGPLYAKSYSRVAITSDLPAIEPAIQCNIKTGHGCGHLPLTDDGTLAPFYPYLSTVKSPGSCAWSVGGDVPGVTLNDFGKNAGYGPPVAETFLIRGGKGKTHREYTAFRHLLPTNPCP